MEAGFTLG